MSPLTHGALCNGIGGFALAARRAGIRTAWTCDIDPFCNAISRKQFPHAHQYLSIYDVHRPPRVDIISAGYPCQPESYAGKRGGAADNRWLWPEVLRLLAECRPRWFIGENVAGHLTLGLAGVLADLEAAGYEVWALVLPACAIGANHRRDRVWIIAHAHHRQPERPPQALRPGRHPACLGCQAAAHAHCQRCREPDVQPLADGQGEGSGTDGRAHPPAAAHPHGGASHPVRQLSDRRPQTSGGPDAAAPDPGSLGGWPGQPSRPEARPEADHGPDVGATGAAADGSWGITQPALCARNDGLPARLVRPDGSRDEAGPEAAQGARQADPRHWARNTLKAAGNALVPQIPELFFQFIADHEAGLIHPNP